MNYTPQTPMDLVGYFTPQRTPFNEILDAFEQLKSCSVVMRNEHSAFVTDESGTLWGLCDNGGEINVSCPNTDIDTVSVPTEHYAYYLEPFVCAERLRLYMNGEAIDYNSRYLGMEAIINEEHQILPY